MIELPSNVRMARAADASAILDLLVLNHAENGLAPLNVLKVAEDVARGCRQDGAVIGLIEGDTGIEASIGLYIYDWWYSDAKHWTDHWHFVHPNHRKSTHAKSLITFAKWFAESMQQPVLLGVMSDTRTEGKLKLYGRQLRLIGGIFYHGPLGPSGAAAHVQRQ